MLTYFKSFTLDSPVFCSVAMLMSSKILLWIYQSFTLLLCLLTSKVLLWIHQSFALLLCLWVQQIYSAFTSLSLCCYAYEFKWFTLHLPVFHSVAMLMSSKNLLCIHQSFTLLLCLWVQKIYSAFTSLSLCCYAYEFKKFTLHLPVFHSVAMLMSSKDLLCIYQSFTLLLCLWVQKIYSAFTSLSLCCYAYEFKRFTLHLPVFHSVAMLMSSKNLLCIHQSFTLLLCLWVQKIYSAFTSLSLCCYAYEFKRFTLHLPVFHSVAMLMSSKDLLCIYQSFTLLLCFSLWANHRWPFLGLFTKDIFSDILTGWGCSNDWYPGDLYTTLCTSTMHLILLDIKMGYCAVSCINGTRFTIYARLFQLKL